MKTTIGIISLCIALGALSCKKESSETTLETNYTGVYKTSATVTFNAPTLYTSGHTTNSKDSILSLMTNARDSAMFIFGTPKDSLYPLTLKLDMDADTAFIAYTVANYKANVQNVNSNEISLLGTDSVVNSYALSYSYNALTDSLCDALLDSSELNRHYNISDKRYKVYTAHFTIKKENGKLYIPITYVYVKVPLLLPSGYLSSFATSWTRLWTEFNTKGIQQLPINSSVVVQTGKVELIKQ
ncbi:hypothetical protein SAMN05421788_111198 [Filimonas lacunae]|uniref:Uncharacterized protein n=1 Tax=Filimonas lacunae TaxID=477680 RepID=A0A173MAM2_9BACT|nr:hypothetical protein [Filimonas lacunae]BAV04604.1 hypothetical protein FLA_0596 [Filimonas lacunae]SIT32683.1 hypothetical protein SAMN05421788_111198 [Filimonas lacunae]